MSFSKRTLERRLKKKKKIRPKTSRRMRGRKKWRQKLIKKEPKT